jgi:hypothetical protein
LTQQVVNVGSAPNDGTGDQLRVAFTKTNDNFSEVYDKGVASHTEGTWNYNKTDTDTNSAPVSGRFKTNSGNYRDATQIAISASTIQGVSRADRLRSLLFGDIIQCQDTTVGAAWCRYTVQSAPVDNGPWFQLNVAYITDGGVASGENQEIFFTFTANVTGSAGGTAEYRFSSATTPPPSSGNLNCNNASLASATIIYVNNITDHGSDIKRVLTSLSVGTALVIQDQSNNANYGRFNISGTPIDQTTYVEIPVTSSASGGTIANNARILFAILGSGGAGGNVSSSGTPTNGQLAQWTDATHIQGIAASSLGYAPLVSPTFSGDPKAPTPTAGDNDTSIATTAFVTTAIAGKADTSALAAYAPLASPALTGNPTAPTATAGDNDTSIATTAFVQTAVIPVQRRVTASPITVAASDKTITCNITSGTPTCALPAAATRTGLPLIFKDATGQFAAHPLTITPNGAETIDGLASLTLSTNYQYLMLVPYNDGAGSGWFIAG